MTGQTHARITGIIRYSELIPFWQCRTIAKPTAPIERIANVHHTIHTHRRYSCKSNPEFNRSILGGDHTAHSSSLALFLLLTNFLSLSNSLFLCCGSSKFSVPEKNYNWHEYAHNLNGWNALWAGIVKTCARTRASRVNSRQLIDYTAAVSAAATTTATANNHNPSDEKLYTRHNMFFVFVSFTGANNHSTMHVIHCEWEGNVYGIHYVVLLVGLEKWKKKHFFSATQTHKIHLNHTMFPCNVYFLQFAFAPNKHKLIFENSVSISIAHQRIRRVRVRYKCPIKKKNKQKNHNSTNATKHQWTNTNNTRYNYVDANHVQFSVFNTWWYKFCYQRVPIDQRLYIYIYTSILWLVDRFESTKSSIYVHSTLKLIITKYMYENWTQQSLWVMQ